MVAVGPGVVDTGVAGAREREGGGGGGGVKRTRFPEVRPKVCFAFMSCGRLELLRLTARALVGHMDMWEAAVPYELAWLDQVGDCGKRKRDRRHECIRVCLCVFVCLCLRVCIRIWICVCVHAE